MAKHSGGEPGCKKVADLGLFSVEDHMFVLAKELT
jgi:hypothetical protein